MSQSIINQPINKSINQSINQLINQSMSQSINRSINQSIDQPINESINRSINQSINQLINQSIDQSIKQSIDRLINQSIDRLINQSIDQPINQTINQSIRPHADITFFTTTCLDRTRFSAPVKGTCSESWGVKEYGEQNELCHWHRYLIETIWLIWRGVDGELIKFCWKQKQLFELVNYLFL